jgi:hypothetical protein
MKDLKVLFTEIDIMEKELKRKSYIRIKFNSPEGDKKLRNASILKSETEERIEHLRRNIIITIRNANKSIINEVRKKLWNSEEVNANIGISIDQLKNAKNSEKLLKDAFLIKAISGPEPDIRDIMEEVAGMVKVAKEKSIDYKKIIKGVLKYASDTSVFNYGSMKSLLENYLKR